MPWIYADLIKTIILKHIALSMTVILNECHRFVWFLLAIKPQLNVHFRVVLGFQRFHIRHTGTVAFNGNDKAYVLRHLISLPGGHLLVGCISIRELKYIILCCGDLFF